MSNRPRCNPLKPAGKCIFCGGGNLSKEHFWPEWASPLLPKYPINEHVEQHLTHTEKTKLALPPKIKTSQGHVWTKKIRVVCARCNNSWMSDLENDSKPILIKLIQSVPHTIPIDASRTLARWIALKIMVGEHNHPNDVVTSSEDRVKFKCAGDIPENFRIWIAKCGVRGWQTAYLRHAATMGLSLVDPPTRCKNIQSVTFGIGDLLVHVLHTTVLELDIKVEKLGLVPLHPTTAPIAWPPMKLYLLSMPIPLLECWTV